MPPSFVPPPLELRNSGISAVGDIPWGTHFCHFYETKQDLLDILTPFFKEGLENNEFCMWIVVDPLSVEEARTELRRAVPDVDDRVAAGAIEILPHGEWYLHDGVLDTARLMERWKERLDRALADGYDGMRANGNATWLTEKEWKDFARYEQQFHKMIGDLRMILMCTHPISVSRGSEIFDVARSHEFALMRRRGTWGVVESPGLRQTKADLLERNEQLEERVMERTGELDAANEQLRTLAGSLLSALEEERTRISREIHDELGSSLTGLQWDLQGMDDKISNAERPPSPAELKQHINSMMKLTNKTFDSMRKIASELRPSILDDLGLVEAIEWQAQEFQARTGIHCFFRCSVKNADLNQDQSTAPFRILQEALTNVLRHAEAMRVDIVLEKRADSVRLIIQDDGKGMPADRRSNQESLGLWGMEERARAAGGTFHIFGAEGRGTTVVVQIPLSKSLKASK